MIEERAQSPAAENPSFDDEASGDIVASGPYPVAMTDIDRFDRADALVLLGLVVVAAAALLPNLGDRCLWQDEAECALVAKNILDTGLPRAWDGRLLVTGAKGIELTDSFLWAWTPWAMHYVAAAGMIVFGETSLGSRLPFALLGIASIGLTYVVARKLLRDRWASCLSAVLLITSVQYLLLMRQCRYYAIVPVAALLAVWGYRELGQRRGPILLTVGMGLLFHANYITCACVGLGLFGHAVVWRRDVPTFLRLGASAAVAAALTLPWFLGLGIYNVLSASEGAGFHREPTAKAFVKLLFAMNQFVCPLVIVIWLVVLGVRRRLLVRGAYRLVACLAVPVLVIIPLFLWAGPRYMVHMLPLGAIVVAAGLREVYLRNDVAGNIGAIMAGVTNLLPAAAVGLMPVSVGAEFLDGDYATGYGALRQGMLKSEWAAYVTELRQSFIGPNEAIVQYLNAHSDPDDIVYAVYGRLPIMLHTNRRCAGLLKPAARNRPGWDKLPTYLFDPNEANWLVIRPAWKPLGGYGPILRQWRQRARRSGHRLVSHNLSVQDIGWGNRPLLRYHHFQSPGPSGTRDVQLLSIEPAAGGGPFGPTRRPRPSGGDGIRQP